MQLSLSLSHFYLCAHMLFVCLRKCVNGFPSGLVIIVLAEALGQDHQQVLGPFVVNCKLGVTTKLFRHAFLS